VSEQRFTVTVGGADVVGVLHAPESRPSPCVVACHGMGASKDSDKYLLLGRELPAAGLALARFDFRGSGESGGSHREATIESRVADLEAVLDHLAKCPELDGRFGLLGSSLGGFVAVQVASKHPGRVSRLVLLAPALDFGGNRMRSLGDVGLDREDVRELAIVRLGPEMTVGSRIDERRHNPHAVAGVPDASVQ